MKHLASTCFVCPSLILESAADNLCYTEAVTTTVHCTSETCLHVTKQYYGLKCQPFNSNNIDELLNLNLASSRRDIFTLGTGRDITYFRHRWLDIYYFTTISNSILIIIICFWISVLISQSGRNLIMSLFLDYKTGWWSQTKLRQWSLILLFTEHFPRIIHHKPDQASLSISS